MFQWVKNGQMGKNGTRKLCWQIKQNRRGISDHNSRVEPVTFVNTRMFLVRSRSRIKRNLIPGLVQGYWQVTKWVFEMGSWLTQFWSSSNRQTVTFRDMVFHHLSCLVQMKMMKLGLNLVNVFWFQLNRSQNLRRVLGAASV